MNAVFFRTVLLGALLLAAPSFADTVEAGDLRVDDAHLAFKDTHIDIFFSIRNTSKVDEALTGANSPWHNSAIVEVTRDADGAEHEAPVSAVLPASGNADFSPDAQWLRLKDVQTEPKETDIVPLTLFFRRSPNAVLHIAVEAAGEEAPAAVTSGEAPHRSLWQRIKDWFKK